MKKGLISESNKYRFNYIMYQMGVMFFPFIPLYLKQNDYSSSQYSLVMSLTPFMVAAALPFCAYLDRSYRGRKYLVMFLAALIIGGILLLVGGIQVDNILGMEVDIDIPTKVPLTMGMVIAAVTVASIARAPINTSIDNFATVYSIETRQEFYKFRAFSSLGYIGAVYLGAVIFNHFGGFERIALLSAASWLVYIFSWSSMRRLKVDEGGNKERHLKILSKNRSFWLYALYYTLGMTALLFSNSYEYLFLEELGILSHLGMLTTVRVGVEVILFIFLSKSKMTYKTMLVLAPFFMMTQSAAYFFRVNHNFFFIFSALSGVGSSFLIFACNKYLNQIVNRKNVSVALYIAAIFQNILLGVLTLAGGHVMAAFNIRYLFLGNAVILCLTTVYAAVILKNKPVFLIKSLE